MFKLVAIFLFLNVSCKLIISAESNHFANKNLVHEKSENVKNQPFIRKMISPALDFSPIFVVHESTMSPSMRQRALGSAAIQLGLNKTDAEIAKYIQEEFNKVYGYFWRSLTTPAVYGISYTSEENSYIRFSCGQTNITLYKQRELTADEMLTYARVRGPLTVSYNGVDLNIPHSLVYISIKNAINSFSTFDAVCNNITSSLLDLTKNRYLCSIGFNNYYIDVNNNTDFITAKVEKFVIFLLPVEHNQSPAGLDLKQSFNYPPQVYVPLNARSKRDSLKHKFNKKLFSDPSSPFQILRNEMPESMTLQALGTTIMGFQQSISSPWDYIRDEFVNSYGGIWFCFVWLDGTTPDFAAAPNTFIWFSVTDGFESFYVILYQQPNLSDTDLILEAREGLNEITFNSSLDTSASYGLIEIAVNALENYDSFESICSSITEEIQESFNSSYECNIGLKGYFTDDTLGYDYITINTASITIFLYHRWSENEPWTVATLYDNPDYEKSSVNVNVISNECISLSSVDGEYWNDRTSSIQIFGSCIRLWYLTNCRSYRLDLYEDVPDLSVYTFINATANANNNVQAVSRCDFFGNNPWEQIDPKELNKQHKNMNSQ